MSEVFKVWGLLRHPLQINIEIYFRNGFNFPAQSASENTTIQRITVSDEVSIFTKEMWWWTQNHESHWSYHILYPSKPAGLIEK